MMDDAFPRALRDPVAIDRVAPDGRADPDVRTGSKLAPICWIAALVSGIAPWLVSFPAPLLDWPNHIARVFIELRLLDGDPFWSRFYALNHWLVPNEALDIGIGGLALLGLNIDVASNLFLIATYLVFVLGITRLAQASRAYDAATPLLATILFLSGPLMFGLANYFLALGAAFWAAAAWMRGGMRRRWLLALLATPAIYTMHLIGAVAFVMIVGAQDFVRWIEGARARRIDLAADASSLAGLALLCALVLTSPTAADSLPAADASNIWYPGHWRFVPTLIWKGRLVVNFFIHHATVLAAATTWIGVLVYVGLVAFLARARAGAGARIVFWTLVPLFVLSPEAMGNGSLLDYRLLIIPPALAIAMWRLSWRREWARHAAVAVALAVCLIRGISFAIS